MNIKKLLGKKIQEIRKSRKLTQEYVAEKIGIETSSLSNIENGRYYPTSENLEKITKILSVKPQELFNFEYLESHEKIVEEMAEAMKYNEKLARIMYKFYMVIQ